MKRHVCADRLLRAGSYFRDSARKRDRGRFVRRLLTLAVLICTALPSLVSPASTAPVTITLWHRQLDAYHPLLETLAERFHERYPHITVENVYQGSYSEMEQSIKDALVSRETPTMALLYDAWVPQCAEALVTLTDALSAEERSDILQGLTSSTRYDGKMLSIPFNRSVQVLYYVEDLVPTPPVTWEEYSLLAQELTVDTDGNGVVDQYGTGFRPAADPAEFLVFLAQNGGSILNEEGTAVTLDSEKAIEAAWFYASFAPYAYITTEYLTNYISSIAMVIDTSAAYYYYERLASEAGLTLRTALLPRGENGTSLSEGLGICIFSYAAQAEIEAAVLYLKFLLEGDNMAFWARERGYYLPCTYSGFESKIWLDHIAASHHASVSSQQIMESFTQPLLVQSSDVQDALRTMCEELLAGTASPQEAVATAAQMIASFLGLPIESNSSPEASFTWQASSSDGTRLVVEPRTGDRIAFDASSSSDPDGEIVEYAWDWTSDGTYDEISADPLAEHWFAEPGAHNVTLRVTDDERATATCSEIVSIASAPEIVEPQEVWALVVGISNYAEVNDLTYARADAEAFARWLLNSGVPSDHIRLLLDEEGTWPELDGLSSELATLTKMRARLEWLRRMAQPDDLVFIFFAGHGYQGSDDDGDETTDGADEFLVLYDAEKDSMEVTTLRDDEFGEFLDRIESNHVMVVFDSCYSGGQSRSLSGGTRPVGDEFDIFNDFSLEGKLVFAAAREDQEALEHEAFGHGVFTHFLLRGLEGQADVNSDYLITAEELYGYVSSEVERFARESKGHEQEPEMTGRGEVGIVVSRTNRPPEASFNIEPEIPYAYGQTRFEDMSTDDTEIVSWSWDLGDGTTSEEPSMTHIYKEVGSFAVALTVTDTEGTTSTIEQEIVIAPPGEVTTVVGDTIIISLGSANGVEVGDRFQVLRLLELASGATIEEQKATVEVVEVVGSDRAACHVESAARSIQPGDALLWKE